MALLTTAQVKERVPQLSGTNQDSLIPKLVGRADALMALYCGYPLQSGTTEPTMESGTYVLRLPEYPGAPSVRPDHLRLPVRPIVSVTSVYLDTEWDFGAHTQIPSADLEVELEAGEIWLRPDSSFAAFYPGAPRSARVTAVCGFATPLDDAHPLVEMGCAVVRHLLNRPQVEGQRSVSITGTSVQADDLDSLLPAAVRSALAPYRLGGSLAG